jgi:dTDP-4-amino-4,6-dideoxygalactose transaminase
MNIHQEPAYAHCSCLPLPHSTSARDSVVLLPFHHEISDDDQAYIIDQIRVLGQ